MDKLFVKAGDNVDEGDAIARLDNSGWSDGAHLHMDTSEGSTRRDPWPLLRQNQPDAGKDDDAMGPKYASDDYERVVNEEYRTLEGARFRRGTTTDAEVLDELPAGEKVIPHARVRGEKPTPDDPPWWFLTYRHAKGGHQEGAFHTSTIEHVGKADE